MDGLGFEVLDLRVLKATNQWVFARFQVAGKKKKEKKEKNKLLGITPQRKLYHKTSNKTT
jgi:hypothetical protein